MKIKYLIVLFLLIIIEVFPLITVMAYTDTYPYLSATQCQDDGTGCVADPWSFWKRECVSYAAWKINESGVAMSNGMSGPNGLSGWFGHAGDWDDNASYIGFTVNDTPTVGSIAVWDPGACTGCVVGHVAYVEKVNQDGSVYISEYNWNYGDGLYNERDDQRASHYIHFSGGISCGGANVVISNQEINSGTTCTSSGTINIQPTTRVTSGNGDVKFLIQ